MVNETVRLAAGPERAWRVFTQRLGGWWPHEYTWSGSVLQGLEIEPWEGGMCYELGPHGFRCDWGRVLAWEPPRRLVIAWQIGPDRAPEPDPARASEVEVRFVPADERTIRLELEHRGFGRYGEAGAAYCDALASPGGWPLILERYRRAVEEDLDAE